MSKLTDVRVVEAKIYFIPAHMRTPLKFGSQVIESISCARAEVTVENRAGRRATGWGETPLSVGWSWPAPLPFIEREKAMQQFCVELAAAWSAFDRCGHPMEIGHAFLEERLPELLNAFNVSRPSPMPQLASLIIDSPFDIALHDAYGMVNDIPVYDTYHARYMNADLAAYLTPAAGTKVNFSGLYPADFFVKNVPSKLPVWHLVGGKDYLSAAEKTGGEPADGYPVDLEEWIERDGLKCLKIKLVGNDAEWDFARLLAVGETAVRKKVHYLSPDFNCTVGDPAYVNAILDRLMREAPEIYGKILYVEQPFPYDLEANQIDVHSVSARKPLFMDESAHDWTLVRLGRELGWTGVALKTCKTQTGALLSMCWAKAHGMTLMVQDLTNPMLAIVPHLLLAAHAGTIMGVECNAMQFYPDASKEEAKIHPKMYVRRGGMIDFGSLSGPGFGYRQREINRRLPEAGKY